MKDKLDVLTKMVELKAESDIAYQIYTNINNQIRELEKELFRGIVAPSFSGLAISMMAKVASGKPEEIFDISAQEIADKLQHENSLDSFSPTWQIFKVIRAVEKAANGSAPRPIVLDVAEIIGISKEIADDIIDRARRDGDLFEARPGMLKCP